MTSFTYRRPKEKSYELLEPGWYTFEIINAYDTDPEGKPLVTRSGTDYVKLVCQEIHSETFIFHYLFLEAEQAAKVSAFLAAIGMKLEDGEEIQLNAETFLQHLFSGRVENSPGKDGITRNKITRVTTQAQPEPEPEPEEESEEVKEEEADEVPF